MNRQPLERVTRRRPCLVCRKFDAACMRRRDDSAALCCTVASDRRVGGCRPGWMHFFDDAGAQAPRPPAAAAARVEAAKPEQFRAPVEHVDAVLTTLVRDCLRLAPEHNDALEARGLSPRAIRAHGYASILDDTLGDEIAESLAEFDLRGVPGFFRDGARWRMKRCPRGFFVPVRNERSQIVGLQIRCDDPKAGKYLWFSSAGFSSGTGSGAPVHFARPHLLPTTNEVLITEGSLKANVIAHFTGSPVVAAAGVGNFGPDFAARLYALAPHVTPIIAFDADWMVKPQVAAALEKIKRELKAVGFPFKVRSWPSRYKGLDDYLLACHVSSRMEVAA